MAKMFRASLCALVTVAIATPALAAEAGRAKVPARETITLLHFATAGAAVESILATPFRVIAFGEYHQTAKTAAIRSALSRFADELLPLVAGRATDIVVETWIADGHCGKQESRVVKEVETTTERPPETENEIVVFLKRAQTVGLSPHILTLSCNDYAFVADEHGGIDFARMLQLTRARLSDEVLRVLNGKPREPKRRSVVVYGGALHNDLHPRPADRRYAFGRSLFERSKGEYIEVDLYIPEYIEHDPRIAAEPWYRLFAEHTTQGDALLIRRSERSFIVVFPRTNKRP